MGTLEIHPRANSSHNQTAIINLSKVIDLHCVSFARDTIGMTAADIDGKCFLRK